MGYRRRTDRNQQVIMDALRAAGWYVHDTSRLGGGFPDLCCAKAGRLVLVEVKDGAKPLSKQALTTLEQHVFGNLLYHGVTVHLVRSVEEAMAL